jgi:CRP/FNR family cyclic AMP-dependent transcriptional regulator
MIIARAIAMECCAMSANRVELLQAMPIFGAINATVIESLLATARVVKVPAGSSFFREDDAADSMFVLESGRVAVSKRWKDKDFILRHLGPGDCFGEMALMDLQPRSASVRAEEDCTAIELRAEDLYRLFERDAEQFALIQMNMGREVCRRLRATDELLFHAEMGTPPKTTERLFRST